MNEDGRRIGDALNLARSDLLLDLLSKKDSVLDLEAKSTSLQIYNRRDMAIREERCSKFKF